MWFDRGVTALNCCKPLVWERLGTSEIHTVCFSVHSREKLNFVPLRPLNCIPPDKFQLTYGFRHRPFHCSVDCVDKFRHVQPCLLLHPGYRQSLTQITKSSLNYCNYGVSCPLSMSCFNRGSLSTFISPSTPLEWWVTLLDTWRCKWLAQERSNIVC